MTYVEGGDEKITSQWLKENCPGIELKIGMLPLISLPNTDRDSGRWFLAIDRKHEHTTVLLFLGKPGPAAFHRRIATIRTRAELIKLYEHLAGEGSWERNRNHER